MRPVEALCPDDLRGGVLFWDGQLEDDAHLVITVARTAAAHGVAVVTHCSAVSVDRGRVSVRDELSGSTITPSVPIIARTCRATAWSDRPVTYPVSDSNR